MDALLDSRQLQAFATVVRRGSFTRAAYDLALTQSAVSHSIRMLEVAVGCRLVDRSRRQVTPTQAGEQFLRHVDRILREMQEAREGLSTLARWGHGRLRVGASATACQHILPAVLREFQRGYPRCVISLEQGDYALQVELLGSGQVDLAILLEPLARYDLAFIPLFQDELCFVVAPGHRWAGRPRVPREELGDETLVLYHKASYTARMVADYFREDRVSLGNTIELGSMDAIKELVKTGFGAGLLAPWVVHGELASGALVALPLGARKLCRTWGVAHLKERRLALGEESFIQLCRSATESLMPLARAS